MGGSHSRTKGHSFERKIANELKRFYPEAKRNVTETQTGGQGVDLVDTGPFKIQCKRYKGYAPINKIFEVVCKAETDIPLLITKADAEPIMVVISMKHFLLMLRKVKGEV